MNQSTFTPHHMNATKDDLAGNNGIGRYILLPGSNGRAEEISRYFEHLTVKQHSRGHHLYLGTISHEGKSIEVATISSGMGCPSMEIILHELFHLGGKRFLRVGTAGSFQAAVRIGELVNVQASVRDEQTTKDYVPVDVPAVASLECMQAILSAAKKSGISAQLHTGTVHCKSSFYAREFGAGPKSGINKSYLSLLRQCGILASEMETSALFIQSQVYNYQLMQQGTGNVLCGAILGIVSGSDGQFASEQQDKELTKKLIMLALETIKFLAAGK